MSPAQLAQQNNRGPGGRYTEGSHTEPDELELSVPVASDDAELGARVLCILTVCDGISSTGGSSMRMFCGEVRRAAQGTDDPCCDLADRLDRVHEVCNDWDGRVVNRKEAQDVDRVRAAARTPIFRLVGDDVVLDPDVDELRLADGRLLAAGVKPDRWPQEPVDYEVDHDGVVSFTSPDDSRHRGWVAEGGVLRTATVDHDLQAGIPKEQTWQAPDAERHLLQHFEWADYDPATGRIGPWNVRHQLDDQLPADGVLSIEDARWLILLAEQPAGRVVG